MCHVLRGRWCLHNTPHESPGSSFKATSHWLLLGIVCLGIVCSATRVSSQLAFLAISTPSRTSQRGHHEREEKQKVEEGEEK